MTAARPLALTSAVVAQAQVNALGHLRAAQYIALFDDAIMALLTGRRLTDGNLVHAGTSPVLTDLHCCYLREVRAGDAIAVSAHVLDVEAKRVRLILLMVLQENSVLAATCELAIVNMDLASRRTTPWSPVQKAVWEDLAAEHRSLVIPPQAGRSIGPLAPRANPGLG